jgi:hypothetical protein
MKVPSIDQRYFHGSSLQFLRGVQTSKSPTQDQDAVPRYHRERPFRRNLALRRIISSCVGFLNLIRGEREAVLRFAGAALALLVLVPVLCVSADGPTAKSGDASLAATAAEPASVPSPSAPVIVFGFLGGFVRHDDAIHSAVQVAQSLRRDYPSPVHIETFENRRMDNAHELIMNLLGAGSSGKLTDEQKRSAHIILYGHSWGASAAVALARALQKEGIPVLLTVQVDSIAKSGQNDAVIPDNVRYAANFYQDKGFLRGQQQIQAADASRTEILGNFRMDYTENPIACPQYPWYTRVFMRSHIEIECDQKVWRRVEGLIREKLPPSGASARTGTP